MMKKNKSQAIIIEKVIAGGLGIGRLPDGLIVLVPYTLADEKARVRIIKRHKDYALARLEQILVPSPIRVEPQCPVYGVCGGCNLQHCDIKNQLKIKQDILKELLARNGIADHYAAGGFITSPPITSPRILGYRLRIRLQVDSEKLRFGYFRYRSHQVVPIDTCLLARPEMSLVLKKLRYSEPFKVLLRQTEHLDLVLNPENGQVVIVSNFKRKPRSAEEKAAEKVLIDIPELQNILFSTTGHGFINMGTDKGERDLVSLTVQENTLLKKKLTMTMEPGGFCQVNQEQNQNLIRILLEWSLPVSGKKILDLFCGMGNFSLPLAMLSAEVVGMDLQRAAIRSAKRNAEQAGLTRCKFEKSSAIEGIKKLVDQGERFDSILLDPPRQGCREVIPYLAATGAQIILYISCNPATLTRDLKEIMGSGYKIEHIRMIDMFPQTHHMEVVTKLVRI